MATLWSSAPPLFASYEVEGDSERHYCQLCGFKRIQLQTSSENVGGQNVHMEHYKTWVKKRQYLMFKHVEQQLAINNTLVAILNETA